MPDSGNEDKLGQEQDNDRPSVIIGRYEILSTLGQGGMGTVYRANDIRLNRAVAVKTILPERASGQEASRRFSREAMALASLNHGNILTIHDFGQEGDLLFLIMELGGQDLGQILEASAGPLSFEQVKHVGLAVCRALEYAHSHGIVHRDLKPGNVLIGTGEQPGWGEVPSSTPVKVMDFGLARMTGASAITGVSQQLGTPQYMSPEQIAGREADEKSDLYSLGILLYELCTGVRPFDGADVQSILSQHLSMAPVPPSAFNDAIPQSLEVLILNLLEKDPVKRPGSARDVLEKLERIATAPVGSTLESNAGTRGIYGRTFVGRENELAQLRSAFDVAMAGRGSLAFVVGEPGIGKTSFCEQLANYVALRGGKTLVGHCYEAGSISLPYIAFSEVIRTHVLSQEVEKLRQEFGTGAADVARIVSEVREKLQVEMRSVGSPDEDRYRLLQSVSEFLHSAAANQPLLVVLEDLHDADKGTLEMLTHVARSISGSKLLIVGTYRDVEVDRTHPLSGSLAELRRVAPFTRINLRGLTGEEVQRMLQSVVQQEVPWGLAEAVHRQTEGNPLFVQEVLRYLVEERLITKEDGRWKATGNTPLAMTIPEGLRDVIGKRLTRLSPECNRILSMASVIGRDFSLQVLQQVANVPEDDLYTAIEEATAAAVVEERSSVGASVTYRFAHAFFRQTLYEEMIAPRRIRLHQHVARALEAHYGARLEEHGVELAEHFSYSLDPIDLAKAVSYGEMAATRARSVYAYGDAVRLLEHAIQVQEILNPNDKTRRCDLLLELGKVLVLAGEPQRFHLEIAPEALLLAESTNDDDRVSRVCLTAIFAMQAHAGGGIYRTAEAVKWAQTADRFAKPETGERALSDTCLGIIECQAGRWTKGRELLGMGLNLAKKLNDRGVLRVSVWAWLTWGPRLKQGNDRLAIVKEFAEEPIRGYDLVVNPLLLAGTWGWTDISILLEFRQRGSAEEIMNKMKELAKHNSQPNQIVLARTMDIILKHLSGELESAAGLLEETLEFARQMGIQGLSMVFAGFTGARPLIELGRPDKAFQIFGNSRPDVAAGLLAHSGRHSEALAYLNELVSLQREDNEGDHETTMYGDIMLLEAAVLTGHREAAERLLRRFEYLSPRTTGVNFTTCIARHLGAALALLDRPEEARSHYQVALEVAAEIRFRPEIALTRFQLAELLLDHYPAERAEALAHLDFAIAEFREMKMQPSLEKALALRGSGERDQRPGD